jgi:hypothetical protein
LPFQNQNAVKIRENTIAWIYHLNPSNLAFHDLIPNKSLPAIAKELLGYNLKFIPSPQVTTGELGQCFSHLTRDIQLKIFFATEEVTADNVRFEHENRPKLYLMKEDWWPPQGAIPPEIEHRLLSFRRDVEPLFSEKLVRLQNLLPYQCKLICDLRRDDNIIICNADKGLGPCAVHDSTYVEDGLVHLKD